MMRSRFTFLIVLIVATLSLQAIELWVPPSNIAYPFAKVAETNEKINLNLYRDVNTELLPTLMKQKAGLYLLPSNVAAKLYNNGIQLDLVATFSTDMLIILSDNPEIHELKDLNGQSFYAGGQGSSPDIVSRYLFGQNAIEVDMQYGNSPEIAKFFVSGKYNNVVLPQPLASFVLNKAERPINQINLTKEWIRLNPESKGIPQLALVSIKVESDELVESLIESFEKYQQEMNTEKKSSAVKIKKLLGYKFNDNVIEESIAPINVYTDKTAMRELKQYFKAIMKVAPKSIGSKLPDEEFFN